MHLIGFDVLSGGIGVQVFDRIFGRLARAQQLVARARLSSYSDSQEQDSVLKHEFGTISDLGFAECGSFEILHHAPKAEPAVSGQFYQDKFVHLCSGDARNALGRAEIKEDYVYDFHYRSDIDFTGIRLDVTLRPSAFEEYRRFVGNVRVPSDMLDPTAWHGDLLISFPSPRFEFPKGRGSPPPYPPPGSKVRNLRTIRSFHFEKLDIIKSRPTHERVPAVMEIGSVQPENVLSLR